MRCRSVLWEGEACACALRVRGREGREGKGNGGNGEQSVWGLAARSKRGCARAKKKGGVCADASSVLFFFCKREAGLFSEYLVHDYFSSRRKIFIESKRVSVRLAESWVQVQVCRGISPGTGKFCWLRILLRQ